MRPPNFRIRGGILEQLRNHIRPTGRDKACGLPKALCIQAPVTDKSFIWLNLHVKISSLFDQCEQVKFIDRLGCNVPDSLQLRVICDDRSDNLGQGASRESAEDRAPESAHGLALLAQKPFDQPVRARSKMPK